MTRWTQRSRSYLRVVLLVLACVSSTSFARVARAEDGEDSVVVFESRAIGVSETAASAVTRQLYATVARLGYRTVPDSVAAEQSARFDPSGTSTAELLRATREVHAAHGVQATVSAASGRYSTRILVVHADGRAPGVSEESSDATSLEPTVDREARKLLPAPAIDRGGGESGAIDPAYRPGFRLALQTEGAFGLTKPSFYNHLLGGRLDYVFTEDVSLGGYLAYANLKGKDGRASNVLPYAMLEYRVRGSRSSRLRIPFRFATGYLPRNGPFLRLSGGLSFPVGKTTILGLDLLAPTWWIAQNRTVVSLDLGVELSFAL